MTQLVLQLSLGEETVYLQCIDKQWHTCHKWDTGRHCNAEYEVHMILQGECRVFVEEKICHLHAGQALVIAPGEYHHPHVQPGPFTRVCWAFHGGALRCSTQTVDLPEPLRQAGWALLQEFAGGSAFRADMCGALLMQAAIGIFRMLGLSTPEQTQQSPQDMHGCIDNFFEENFPQKAGQTQLAAQLHISTRQLDRVLQGQYGMGFREKLIAARMDRAAWLLRTTQFPVGRVAEAVGYSSESAFFKVFRANFGMTPLQYRKKKQK